MEEDRVLEDVRGDIDELDSKLLVLLKERSALVSRVAAIKQQYGLTAHQPERFERMMNDLHEQAKGLGLDQELVSAIWNAVHASSQNQQNKTLN